MKKISKTFILMGLILLLNVQVEAQIKNSKSKKEQTMEQVLIDKINVPVNSKEEFIKRMNANRKIIKKQPGFIKDEVYEQQDENGNAIFITIAVWENEELINKAKETVQAEYKRIGFNLNEFCQKWNIKMDRSIYQPFNQ